MLRPLCPIQPPLEHGSQRKAVSAQLPQANKRHRETEKQEGYQETSNGGSFPPAVNSKGEGQEPAQAPLFSEGTVGPEGPRSQGMSETVTGGPHLSLHYWYQSTFAFTTQLGAFSLLTSHLHANLDVRPWLCFWRSVFI